MNALLRFFGDQRGVALLLFVCICGAGVFVAPFDLGRLESAFPRSPVHVDAIPDTGENQQVVFTSWPGSAADDVERYLTFPLTSELLALSGVETIRSTSAYGFSALYILFDDDQDFYEARTRLGEKLASLRGGLLPEGVTPRLGPDATGLGQVFWYVLEAQTADGHAAPGAFDLRELRTIQDDTVRPALSSVAGVAEVASIGGYVTEWQVEVDLERLAGLGLRLDDVQAAVRQSHLDVSGGILENNGAEYVLRGQGRIESADDLESAVVRVEEGRTILLRDVARIGLGPAPRRGLYDLNGQDAVGGVVVVRYGENPRTVLQAVRERIATLALPRRSRAGAEVSVQARAIYDRSELIDDTVATLGQTLEEQLALSVLVLMLMLGTIRGAFLAAAVPPLGIIVAFFAMWLAGIEANAMSLAGIAIAIGSMIDIGIVFVESVHRRSDEKDDEGSSIVRALALVAPATMTSVLTSVLSFLPVFALGAGAGRLYRPLAFTKTFALLGALLVALVFVAPAARTFMRKKKSLPIRWRVVISLPLVALLLYLHRDSPAQMVLLAAALALVTVLFIVFEGVYPRLLRAVLARPGLFLLAPLALCIAGAVAASSMEQDGSTPFDEGSFLYMPSTPPHASVATVQRLLRETDAAIAAIPEVRHVLGKAGRVLSALDPAPLSMFETMIFYVPEYALVDGERVRQWRDHIHSPADIWAEVVRVASRPGLTPAPMLQPIETRQIMLRTGMRGPLGVRLQGARATDIAEAASQVEALLRHDDAVREGSVQTQQDMRVPYLDVTLDREALATFGLRAGEVLSAFAAATAGTVEGEVFEGRSRRAIRVRGERSDRQSREAIEAIPLRGGAVVLGQVAAVEYVQGPTAIRSEDTFETRYVLFSPPPTMSAGESARQVEAALEEVRFPEGVSASLAGTFREEAETTAELRVLVPVALLLVFFLVYFQFRHVLSALFVFAGALVAVAGGLCTLWLANTLGVADISLSPGVIVGFIALVGIAVDDGVLMMTFLRRAQVQGSSLVEAVVQGASERISACLMTTATTILALLPVLLAGGRGSDLMVPMAWPLLGGMTFELLTLFVVPALFYSLMRRRKAPISA